MDNYPNNCIGTKVGTMLAHKYNWLVKGTNILEIPKQYTAFYDKLFLVDIPKMYNLLTRSCKENRFYQKI